MKGLPGLAVVAALVGSASVAPLRAQDPASIYEIVRPAPGLLVAQTRADVPASAYAAAVAVVGRDGVLIVDAHHGPTAARWMSEQLRAQTSVPVRWVVVTHAHGDHYWGTSAWRERFPQAEILAHPAAIATIRERGAGDIVAERERLENRAADIADALTDGQVPPGSEARWESELRRTRDQILELARVRIVPPGTSVEAPMEVDLGDTRVRLEPGGPAHTAGDLLVWVGDDTVILGDLLEKGTLWLQGADVRGWSRTLQRVVESAPTTVIASHGGVMDPEDLRLHARVLAAAVALADTLQIPDRTDILSRLGPLVDALVEGGVDREAAEAYVIGAVEGAMDPGARRESPTR